MSRRSWATGLQPASRVHRSLATQKRFLNPSYGHVKLLRGVRSWRKAGSRMWRRSAAIPGREFGRAVSTASNEVGLGAKADARGEGDPKSLLRVSPPLPSSQGIRRHIRGFHHRSEYRVTPAGERPVGLMNGRVLRIEPEVSSYFGWLWSSGCAWPVVAFRYSRWLPKSGARFSLPKPVGHDANSFSISSAASMQRSSR